MQKRIAAVFLSMTLTGAIFGFGFYYLINYERGAMTLAELSSGSASALGPSADFDFLSQPMQTAGAWLSGLEVDVIIYSAVGLAALLVVLRVLFATVRTIKEEISFRAAESHSDRFAVLPAATPSLRVVPKGAAGDIEHDPRGYAARFAGAGRHAVDGLRWNLRAYGQGLSGRIVLTFTAVVALFGVITAALVYFTLTKSLTGHAIQRAQITAVNVSDSAPFYLMKQDAAKLREVLRKHVSKPPMAYVLVEQRSGEIFAHSFAVLPDEVQTTGSAGATVGSAQRTLRVGEGMVYEVSVPILDGQIGAVRVGIWKGDVDAAIGETIAPLIKWLLLVILGGTLLALILAWNISRPIVRLVRIARRISHGELDAPSLGVEDRTEFGELSRALERMRSSVKAAVMRLS